MEAEKVKISNVWHLPFHLVKKETELNDTYKPNKNKDEYHKINKDLNATAVVRLKAPKAVTSRCPIYLVVAIDVSCSTVQKEAPPPANMPSRLDLLKKALMFIMRQLHDGDDFTIVFSNNTNEKFEIPKDTQTEMEKKVDKHLAKADSTAFRTDLKEAWEIIEKDKAERVEKKRLPYIILLSDGLDKSNFKWDEDKRLEAGNKASLRALLEKYPVQVHTFGLDKDHDPSALLFIANESKGTYSSITKNVNSMLIEALAVCLGGLTNIVAVDTVIKIKAIQDDNGTRTKITAIEGEGSLLPRKVNAASCKSTIGILYAGEVKDLIVHFKVEIGYFDQGPSDYAPLSAEGHYKVIPGGESMTIKQLIQKFSVYARKICTPLTEQPLLPFPVVKQQMVRTKVLGLVARFQEEYQKQKRGASEDGRKQEGKQAVANIAWSNLMEQWNDFKNSNETWKNALEVGLDVERIENDIETMERGLKRGGLGVGCVYAWMSSHQMQRATTSGLPATSFLTPAMKEMLQKAQIELEQEEFSSAARNTGSPFVPPGEVCLCKRLELLSKIDPEKLRQLAARFPRDNSEAETETSLLVPNN